MYLLSNICGQHSRKGRNSSIDIFTSLVIILLTISNSNWTEWSTIQGLILLPEKFLPFDWLSAEVFQLNLKYLHVKITVTMVTQNHQIISSHELRKNGGKISRF